MKKLVSAALLALCVQWSFADTVSDAEKAIRIKQFDKGFTLYLQAAREGNVKAQYKTGKLYLSGVGTNKDLVKAKFWFNKASEQSHPAAQYNLGLLIKESDLERANSLIQASADQGYRAAKSYLQKNKDGNVVKKSDSVLLFSAVKKGDTKKLKQLKKQGVDLTQKDKNNRSTLHIASEFNHTEAALYLLKQKMSVTAKDGLGVTPIMLTVENGNLRLFKAYLKKVKGEIPLLPNGDTLLHLSLRKDYERISQELIGREIALNVENKEGWTALDLAKHLKRKRMVSLLQTKGAKSGSGWLRDGEIDVQLVAQRLSKHVASGNFAPLEEAMLNDKLTLFLALLDQSDQADINEQQGSGSTLVGLSVKQDKPEFLEALIARGASVNVPDEHGTTPLIIAVRTGNLDMLDTLTNSGADPLAQDNKARDAVDYAIIDEREGIAHSLLDSLDRSYVQYKAEKYLLLATSRDMTGLIDRLVDKRYKLNLFDDSQRNALWFAVKNNRPEIVDRLIKAGVSPDFEDNNGHSLLTLAADSGCLACAKKVVKYTDVNHQIASGMTALMIAAKHADENMTRWLISQKTDVEIRDNQGSTAVIHGVTGKSNVVVKLLVEADANVTRKNKLGVSALDLAKQGSPSMLKVVKKGTLIGIF